MFGTESGNEALTSRYPRSVRSNWGGWDVSDERGKRLGGDALTGICTEDQDTSMSLVWDISIKDSTSSWTGTMRSSSSPECVPLGWPSP